jgi:hypothetical protein
LDSDADVNGDFVAKQGCEAQAATLLLRKCQ